MKLAVDGYKILDIILDYLDYLLLDKKDYKGYFYRKNIHIAEYGFSPDQALRKEREVLEKGKYQKLQPKMKMSQGKSKTVLRELPNFAGIKGLTDGERALLQQLIN